MWRLELDKCYVWLRMAMSINWIITFSVLFVLVSDTNFMRTNERLKTLRSALNCVRSKCIGAMFIVCGWQITLRSNDNNRTANEPTTQRCPHADAFSIKLIIYNYMYFPNNYFKYYISLQEAIISIRFVTLVFVCVWDKPIEPTCRLWNDDWIWNWYQVTDVDIQYSWTDEQLLQSGVLDGCWLAFWNDVCMHGANIHIPL